MDTNELRIFLNDKLGDIVQMMDIDIVKAQTLLNDLVMALAADKENYVAGKLEEVKASPKILDTQLAATKEDALTYESQIAGVE